MDSATCKEEGLGPFIHQELNCSGGGWVEGVVVVESLHISCTGEGGPILADIILELVLILSPLYSQLGGGNCLK